MFKKRAQRVETYDKTNEVSVARVHCNRDRGRLRQDWNGMIARLIVSKRDTVNKKYRN